MSSSSPSTRSNATSHPDELHEEEGTLSVDSSKRRHACDTRQSGPKRPNGIELLCVSRQLGRLDRSRKQGRFEITMNLPTEPIGSIPRTPALIDAMRAFAMGRLDQAELARLGDEAVRETIAAFEATGSPVITDGEQTKPSFATYPVHGLPNLAPDGVTIPFADGHTRQLPRLSAGPFRYRTYAASYTEAARRHTQRPLKQAVISPSALSLLYPEQRDPGLPERDVSRRPAPRSRDRHPPCARRGRLQGADRLHGRPAGRQAGSQPGTARARSSQSTTACSDRFSDGSARGSECTRVPAATAIPPTAPTWTTRNCCQACSSCGSATSTSSSRASGTGPGCSDLIKAHLKPSQRVFIGVTDPIDPRVETPEAVRDRVLEAARVIPVDQLGTTDDCGFAPFADDTSTARETAFAKIRARVEGTELASRALGV